jgi:hypothetical protein
MTHSETLEVNHQTDLRQYASSLELLLLVAAEVVADDLPLLRHRVVRVLE